jgi:transcriptional regulator with XRE-family HTH domain
VFNQVHRVARRQARHSAPVPESTVSQASNDAHLPPPLALGYRIRHARLTKGLRLQDLAERVGCSKSMLSKVESDRVVPSLPMLQRLAHSLGVELASLFAGVGSDEQVVARAGARPVLDTDPLRRGAGIRYERLVPLGRAVLLEANIHIIEPGGGREDAIQHQGEELGLVLEGQLELTVGGRSYLASAQDSFFFSSILGHSYRNPGPGLTRVMWVNTPPVH